LSDEGVGVLLDHPLHAGVEVRMHLFAVVLDDDVVRSLERDPLTAVLAW